MSCVTARLCASHALEEAVEQVQAVVRAGSRLGVVLDRPAGHVEQLEALDGAVVEVHVRQLPRRRSRSPSAPARRSSIVRAPAGPERGEAVVLGGDLDAPGLQVAHRVVGAAVAEGQLEGLQADRPAEQLVAEADPPHRLARRPARGPSRRCSRAPRGRRGRWRGRPRRGPAPSSSAARAGAGVQRHARAAGEQLADHRGLDARVEHGDARPVAVAVAADLRGGDQARRGPGRPSAARRRSARAPALGQRAAGRRRPRIAPASRMCITSARVSTPLIAGTPQSASQSSQPPLGARVRPRDCRPRA